MKPQLNYQLSLWINVAMPAALGLIATMVPQAASYGDALWAWLAGVWSYWLIEYLGHRAFHVFDVGHEAHHDAPRDTVAMPFWIGTIAHFFALNIVWWLFGLPIALAFVMGSSLAYAGYCLLHAAMHHAPALVKRSMPQGYENHQLHHAKGDVNFGVSVWIFDWFFGTLDDARQPVTSND